MKPAPDGQKAGPPPAVKAILSKFGSGKEEDKLVGYLSFLKIGPALCASSRAGRQRTCATG